MQSKAESIAKQRVELGYTRICAALETWEKCKSSNPLDHAFVTAELRLEQARRYFDEASTLYAAIRAHGQSNP